MTERLWTYLTKNKSLIFAGYKRESNEPKQNLTQKLSFMEITYFKKKIVYTYERN